MSIHPLAPRLQPAVPRQAASASRPTARPASWLATRQAPAATLEEGFQRLQAVADRLEARGDRRAVFASTYMIQIRAFAEDVRQPGHYQNPAWMQRMTLDFLQRYLDALAAYDRGDLASVPQAWRIAFDHAAAGKGPVVGDLLLAMNAHINHDLPLAVAATGPSPSVQADYRRFNDVLAAHIDEVQALICSRYLKPSKGEPLAARGDRWLGGADEALVAGTIRRWREAAWANGVAVVTQGQAAYGAIQRRSASRASMIALGAGLVPSFLAKRGQF